MRGDPIFSRRAVNDPVLRDREIDHRGSLSREHDADEQRFLSRLARGTLSLDVWLSTEGRPERRHVLEALAEHPRLLLVGPRWSGKSTLASHILSQTARRDVGFGDHVPFAAPGKSLADEINEAILQELSPAAGIDVIRTALESGRGLVVVDGLDEAQAPDKLKQSIALFAKKYPYSRFLVLTRPLPSKLAGKSETNIDGFLTLSLAGPRKKPGATILELYGPRRDSEYIQNIGAEIDQLLDLWRPQHLPPGTALRNFTERGRFHLVCHLATYLYDTHQLELTASDLAFQIAADLENARWFADTEQLLHESENPQSGEPVADRDALAKRIVEDIRQHPGAILETRPGMFGLPTLEMCRYLTAAYFLGEGFADELLMECEDPWFHPVVVMAAGLGAPFSSKVPARALIGMLLRMWVAPDSFATFLADQAAEVARELPPSIRKEIDRRLRAALPLRSDIQLIHVVDDIRDIAAPALLRCLPQSNATDRARILTALGRLDHPEIIRTLARYVTDEELTTETILCWAWHVDGSVSRAPVGFFAFAAFFNLALINPAASGMYDQVLAKTPDSARAIFVELVVQKVLGDFFRGAEMPEERDPWRSSLMMEKLLAKTPYAHPFDTP